MRKYKFTNDEIDANASSRKDWHNFVRRREAEIIFSLVSGRQFRRGLELGAGDGGQSVIISNYCDELICTDIDETSHSWLGQSILERKLCNVNYTICDAQDLSKFSDSTFDLIFSSNMLEHVPDVRKCLLECSRVLKHDGLMLHTMPNKWWKISNVVFGLLLFKPPVIHGVSPTHYKEFLAFGATAWKQQFETVGLVVHEIIGLPFYIGHGNSFLWAIKTGNMIGLSASNLYIVSKGVGVHD